MSYKHIIDRIPDSAFIWYDRDPAILVDYNGNRWFLATDVARALGHNNYERAINTHLKQTDYKRLGQIRHTIVSKMPIRMRDDFRFLNDNGVYHMIIKSVRKPYAKELIEKYFD